MHAVRIHEDGGPEVLRYEEAPDPVAARGRGPRRLRAASLNHLDVWVRKGLPSVPKPRSLAPTAQASAGHRRARRHQPGLEHGDRITVLGETATTHAELIAVPGVNVYPLPD